jgi:tetratricopeptide (TPR) repeat protein
VIRPVRGGEAAPELVRDAGLVRQSLEKLQAKDEAGALGLLRDLARSSPLSEWKFFVRGVAAFYRGDAAEAQANWDRLDPERLAFPITQRLRRLAAEETDADPKSLVAWETLVFSEPILERVQQLRSLTASQEWDKVLRLIGPLRLSLYRVDPKLAERLTVVLIGSLVKGAQDMRWAQAKRLVTNFIRAAQPLAIDPRWNRLWGILWDGPQAEPSGGIRYWSAYIQDLETIEAFNPSERALAQAMVWNHVAELYREQVDDLEDQDDEEDRAEVAAAKKEAIACLERSLRLAPDYLPTYRHLVHLYDDWDDEKKVAATAQRLLAKFPEDVDTLQLLGEHYVESNDLAAALPHVQKARRVKPLDESLRELEWTIRVGLARNCALSQRWDEGRAEFAAADALLPDTKQQYFYLARKAIFELKAGRVEESDRYQQEAQKLLVEPAPLWLALAIESIRYHMTKETVDIYSRLWEADLKKKRRSETAGELAELLGGFLTAGIAYRGQDQHIEQVVAYLRGGSRLKYRREDIERIVEFLGKLPKPDPDLVEKLLKPGLKQHPDSALLNLFMGSLELSKGRFLGGNTSARRHLETALRLAEASTDPKVTAHLPKIRAQFSMLDEMMQRTRMFGSFFGGGPVGPSSFDGLDFDDFDLDDEEFEDDDEEFVPAPSPRATRTRGPKRSSRKKR